MEVGDIINKYHFAYYIGYGNFGIGAEVSLSLGAELTQQFGVTLALSAKPSEGN